jgi:hypothetical protein
MGCVVHEMSTNLTQNSHIYGHHIISGPVRRLEAMPPHSFTTCSFDEADTKVDTRQQEEDFLQFFCESYNEIESTHSIGLSQSSAPADSSFASSDRSKRQKRARSGRCRAEAKADASNLFAAVQQLAATAHTKSGLDGSDAPNIIKLESSGASEEETLAHLLASGIARKRTLEASSFSFSPPCCVRVCACACVCVDDVV